jgi:hypothetical protein
MMQLTSDLQIGARIGAGYFGEVHIGMYTAKWQSKYFDRLTENPPQSGYVEKMGY